MRVRASWCTKCNKETPSVRKGLRSRWTCMVCHEPVLVRSKFGNIPTKSKHTGRTFQSKKEANREPVLLALQNVGEIVDLKYQVPYRLDLFGTQAVEALLEALDATKPEGWCTWIADSIQNVRRSRQCVGKWIADYAYETKSGETVVEDVKGYPTPIYSLKKKLVSVAHGLEIQEPTSGGVQQKARGAGIAGRGTGARLMGGR